MREIVLLVVNLMECLGVFYFYTTIVKKFSAGLETKASTSILQTK